MPTRHLVPLLALAACGGDGARHATPTGTLAGRVLDGHTEEPLADVTMELFVGSDLWDTETDGDGRFYIRGVPAGSALWLDARRDSYGAARLRDVAVDDAAGEQPQSNSITIVPDIRLFKNNFTILAHLEADGDNVEGARVFATGTVAGYELADRISAPTDAEGDAQLTGITYAATYRIGAEPFQIGGKAWYYTEPREHVHAPAGDNRLDLEAIEAGSEGEAEAEAEGEGCNGTPDPCCNVANSCAYGSNDGICDCPDCPWEQDPCP